MEQNQYIVAIEIGSSKIVAAVAEKSVQGVVTVTRLKEEKLTNCVRYGNVQNVETTKASLSRIIKQLEYDLDGRITSAYVGVSGVSLHSVPIDMNRTLDSSKSITNEIVNKIIQEAEREPVDNYETIALIPASYTVDGNATKEPSGMFAKNIKIKVNRIVASPTLKKNLERVMSIPLSVRRYLITPYVTGKEVLNETELSLGGMLVDMGAETTDVAIFKNDALVYLNTLPLGGRNLTHDIEHGLNVLEDSAEKLKKNIANPLDAKPDEAVEIDGISSFDASKYINARMGEIIANINAQIEYAGLTASDIRSIVLIGGSSQLPGLATKMQKEIKVDSVRLGSTPDAINITNHAIDRVEYTEVLALLQKGAELLPEGETCVELNTYIDEGPTITQPIPPAQPTVPEEPKKPIKNKNKWYDKFKDFGKRLMDETDVEEE